MKPRVRCHPPHEAPPGVLVSLSCGAAWPPSSRGVTHVPCSWLRARPQLLEDLDEQLSCTRFEEAAVSRRIASGGCSAQAGEVPWGAQGPQSLSMWGVSPSVSPPAGKTSCWLNLNVGLLREQLLAIQSKRRKLGKELGRPELGTGSAGSTGSLGTCAPKREGWGCRGAGAVTSSPQSGGTERHPGRGTWATPWPCWASWR